WGSGARTAPPPGVTADGLTVLRDGRVLLENAEFDNEPGAFAFLIDTADGAAQAVQRMASGLRPAPGGALLVNGADPAAFRAGPRARAAFVSADSAPLNGTILENLTLFGRGASVDDARAAAQLLDLERVINRLPEGYDTRMASSGGATLPAGIVHSILLARAIAQRPLLLAAHRPFAYLDATAERRTLQALKALRDRCTVLVSSNRTQFAAHADLVLSFENGRCLSRAPLSFRAPRPEDGATGGEDATAAAGAPPAATGGAA
ncbi:MAG: ABC transporter ATP-binding protein, partial [Pseudomonadota bacterium]